MHTNVLRAQHTVIMGQASELGGMSSRIKIRDDAVQARQMIMTIDKVLVAHLKIEDDWLYPSLMAAEDPEIRHLGADCQEEMGGILGAWTSYRDQWDVDEIFKLTDRFAMATAGIVGAVAMRVDRENTELYPAMDQLIAGTDQSRRAH